MEFDTDKNNTGLNPCYNGICSMSEVSSEIKKQLPRLNPCYNGICSMRHVTLHDLKLH